MIHHIGKRGSMKNKLTEPTLQVRSMIGIDWKYLVFIAALFTIAIGLKQAGLGLVFVILIARCVKGGANEVLEGLMIATVIRFFNPMLIEPGLIPGLGSVALTGVSFIVLFCRMKPGLFHRKSVVAWTIFFVYMLLTSLAFSSYRDVSVFKITMSSLTFLVSCMAMRAVIFRNFEVFLFNFFLCLVVFSMPLLAYPAIGMAQNDLGFQGILGHPQNAGSVLAHFLAYFIVLFIYAKEQFKSRWLLTPFIIISLYFLYKTQARTGMFALVLAIIGTIAIVSVTRRFPLFRKVRASKLVVAGLGVSILIGTFAVNELQHFVFKSRGAAVADVHVESVYSSREGIVTNALYSLQNNPIFGIGYGVASPYVHMEVTYLPGTSIPISAPTEKGVMLVAILEEGGVVGLILLLVALGALLQERLAINPVYVVTLLIPFLVNFGEFNFFAANGLGPIMMVFVLLQPQKSNWGKLA